MSKMIFGNLPVVELKSSMVFYEALGFKNNPMFTDETAACMVWSETIHVMLLARVLGQLRYGVSVAAVGVAGGSKLPTTVNPFLLRGVNLLGIDSVNQPYENRLRAWQRIATDRPLEKLDAMIRPATLEPNPKLATEILKGKIKGRIVVDVTCSVHHRLSQRVLLLTHKTTVWATTRHRHPSAHYFSQFIFLRDFLRLCSLQLCPEEPPCDMKLGAKQ